MKMTTRRSNFQHSLSFPFSLLRSYSVSFSKFIAFSLGYPQLFLSLLSFCPPVYLSRLYGLSLSNLIVAHFLFYHSSSHCLFFFMYRSFYLYLSLSLSISMLIILSSLSFSPSWQLGRKMKKSWSWLSN